MKNEVFVSFARRGCGRCFGRYGHGRRHAHFALARAVSKRWSTHGAVCQSRGVFAVGAVSLALHIKNGLVKKDNLLFFLVPALATCVACSFFAVETSGELLKKLFGGFLVALSICSFFSKTLKKY